MGETDWLTTLVTLLTFWMCPVGIPAGDLRYIHWKFCDFIQSIQENAATVA
jgi:hypothetical protein